MQMLFLFTLWWAQAQGSPQQKPPLPSPMRPQILSYVADLKKQTIEVHWKDDKGKTLGSLDQLIRWKKSQKQDIQYATNGGMFMENFSPLGLYIEKGIPLRKLITVKKAYGNFYLQPNGVFAITKSQKALIVATDDVKDSEDWQSATQSGPMLVHQGAVNKNFTKGSRNLEVRNGVGVLPDGKVLFAISQNAVNFYDFATFFKEKGCLEALYFDGSVSQVYQPEKGVKNIYGPLGVLISVSTRP